MALRFAILGNHASERGLQRSQKSTDSLRQAALTSTYRWVREQLDISACPRIQWMRYENDAGNINE